LRRTLHGKPLVYLDSTATSQKPQVVLDAMQSVRDSLGAEGVAAAFLGGTEKLKEGTDYGVPLVTGEDPVSAVQKALAEHAVDVTEAIVYALVVSLGFIVPPSSRVAMVFSTVVTSRPRRSCSARSHSLCCRSTSTAPCASCAASPRGSASRRPSRYTTPPPPSV
jgi:hypothetical protein